MMAAGTAEHRPGRKRGCIRDPRFLKVLSAVHLPYKAANGQRAGSVLVLLRGHAPSPTGRLVATSLWPWIATVGSSACAVALN